MFQVASKMQRDAMKRCFYSNYFWVNVCNNRIAYSFQKIKNMSHNSTINFRIDLINFETISEVISQVECVKNLVLELDDLATFEIVKGNERFHGPMLNYLFDEFMIFLYKNLMEDGCVEINDAGEYSENDFKCKKDLFSKSFVLDQDMECISIYLKSKLDRSEETKSLLKSKKINSKISLMDEDGWEKINF
jgi:hypothetical protein